ncbi:hypothetical protein FE257_013025 [Aspergillus nanangensis]|uniref:ferric-chelate reductase (NADPH) n=1 Tax=Aspergillus nanangensis TaxID=2582783 RepID=A0AAD4CFH3_ASPNN|nr:hypothetical protein FE257_013025 [Aspergillus nanangensis]
MALNIRAEEHVDDAVDIYYNNVDTELSGYALMALGGTAALILAWNGSYRLTCYVRQIATLNNERQHYFRRAYRWLAAFRKHILYAPLFRTRHHREYQLSRAVNMGTLPSRSHTLLLIGILALNVTLCTINVPYGTDRTAGVIRNRAGTLAVTNLIPLVLLAGRNNPLISLLRIPYDTFNLFHRWFGRIVVLEALTHAFSWLIPKAQGIGWNGVVMIFKESGFIRAGLVAVCAFAFILVHSPSPIRHAFYETFLHVHIAVVATVLVTLWIHLDHRPAQSLLLAAIVLWGLERLARVTAIIYRNCGRRLTVAVIESLPDDLLRIALYMPRPWHIKPGQHVYLCIPTIGLWTTHPFSVAWSDADPDEDYDHDNEHPNPKGALYLLVRRRSGFTDSLAKRVTKTSSGVLPIHAIVEGPYGEIHSMDSYGTVMLFAGGAGITHHLPYISHLVRGHAKGIVAAQRITLVWAIRSPGYLEAIQPWLDRMMRDNKGGREHERETKGGNREEVEEVSDTVASVLRILVYVTGASDEPLPRSRFRTMQVMAGRPSFGTLIRWEAEKQVGAMAVVCCGPGGFSDDVRRACRKAQRRTEIVLFEESFTW